MTPRWKWLAGIGALFLGPLLFVLVMHFKAKRDVSIYKKGLVARGEKLTIAELIPPTVDVEKNGAADLLESIAGLSRLNLESLPSMTLVAPGKAKMTWAQEEVFQSDETQRTNFCPILRQNMANAEEDLELLHQALRKPKISFRPQYEMGFMAPLSHVMEVKKAAQWLVASTLFYLHENRTNEAAASLTVTIRLPVVDGGEPMMISQLVRLATVYMAFTTTWEALQFGKWNDATLKEFQEAWSTLEMGKDFETALAMERAMGIPYYKQARSSTNSIALLRNGASPTLKDEIDEIAIALVDDPKTAFRLLMRRPSEKVWQFWWSYGDEEFMIRNLQEAMEKQRLIQSVRSYHPAIEQLKIKDEQETPAQFLLAGLMASSSSRFFLKCAVAETQREMAMAACALERHRIRHGNYPERLDNLIPEFLASAPRDLMDGQSLKYRRNEDGTFLLYAVGENGKDDGGDASFETSKESRGRIYFQRGRDWVWPQRATAAEIKKWEEEQFSKRSR